MSGVSGFGFRGWGLEFKVYLVLLPDLGLGCRVSGLGFRVRVEGFGVWV